MQNAVPIGEGSMIAILGTKISEIKKLIDTKIDLMSLHEIANDNAEGQVIVSGSRDTINHFQQILKDYKIKSIPLKVSAPFHCSMMKPAAEILKSKIEQINFKEPKFQIISNVNALPEKSPQE